MTASIKGPTPTVRREIVEAGAGCGKTTRLVARYLDALGIDAESGSERPQGGNLPSQIIALTFTEEAALNMKERVLNKLLELNLPQKAKLVLESSQISTFHSLCYRAIKNHLYRLGYHDSIQILPEFVTRSLRKRHILESISQFSESSLLLKYLNQQELVELALKFWFYRSENKSENKEPSLFAADHLLSHFQKTLQHMKHELSMLESQHPTEFSTDPMLWPAALKQNLSLSDLTQMQAELFNFQRGSKKAKQEPFLNLYENTKALKEFIGAQYPKSLSGASLQQETEAQKCLERFLIHCQHNAPKLLDFAALEFELARLLEQATFEDLGMRTPKVLLVDEFQDTNRTQFSIIRHLSSPDTEWFFVGDPKQSIYAFRGADVSLFFDQSKELTNLTLDTNYRTQADPLEFINLVQEHLFAKSSSPIAGAESASLDPSPQVLKCGAKPIERPPIRAVKIHWSENIRDDFFAPLREDLVLRKNELGTQASQAVLFSSWKRLFDFATYLESQRVPFSISGTSRHLSHLLSAVFADFLSWCAEPKLSQGLVSCLKWMGLDSEVTELCQKGQDSSSKTLLPERIAYYKQLLDVTEAELSLKQYLHRFTHLILPQRFDRGREWAAAMESFINDCESDRLQSLFSLKDFAGIIRDGADHFEHHSPAQERAPEPGVVTLLTIHGSKGLEFDSIFLPELYSKIPRQGYLAAGGHESLKESPEDNDAAVNFELFDAHTGQTRPALLFQKKKRESDVVLEAEKKRLFYVALTRAKQSINIYAVVPKDKTAKVDSQSYFLGFPRMQRTFWNSLLADIKETPGFLRLIEKGCVEEQLNAQIKDEEAAKMSGPSAKTMPNSKVDSLINATPWVLPLPRDTNKETFARTNFYRTGVRQYLDAQAPKNAGQNIQKKEQRSTPVTNLRHLESMQAAADMGKRLHQILELWDGNLKTLDQLLADRKDYSIIHKACTQLRDLAQLKDFWQAAAEKSDRLLREYEMIISAPEFRLTGVADAILIHNSTEMTIIDWKTGAQFENLSKPERIEKLRGQLKLYSMAFAKQYSRIHGLGIGIGLSSSNNPPDTATTVEVIFDETLC